MVFFTKFFRSDYGKEKMSPVDKVCREGVVSAKRQIENLINAGANLLQARANEFDFSETDDVDSVATPFMREQELDKLDALQMMHDLKVKVETPVDDSLTDVKEFKEEIPSTPAPEPTPAPEN